MPYINRIGLALSTFVAVIASLALAAQPPATTYRLVDDWPRLPASMNGGEWGETIGVDHDPDGNVWVLHRCFATEPAGAATCVGRDELPPILKFDPSGRLLDSWGEARFAFPHGFHIDPNGNVWATDANGSETVLGLSAGGRGHQVFKFSPTGELLLTLGRSGVAGNERCFEVARQVMRGTRHQADVGIGDVDQRQIETVYARSGDRPDEKSHRAIGLARVVSVACSYPTMKTVGWTAG